MGMRTRNRAGLVLVVVASVIAGAACTSNAKKSASSPTTLAALPTAKPQVATIQAGINDQTIAVNAFMPASVSVAQGSKVTWTWQGALEPHSVTFLAPDQTLPPPGSDPKLSTTSPESGPYAEDGTALVNSGLQPRGSTPATPFTVTFPKAGAYIYHCVIHAGMTGTVTVQAGGPVDKPKDILAKGNQELKQWLAEGRTAKANLEAIGAKATHNPDRTTTWTVEMGVSTPHTSVLAFSVSPIRTRASDKVTFVNNSAVPHTASFFGTTPPIKDPSDPKVAAPAPGKSPQALNVLNFFNTGIVPADAPPGSVPQEARSFTFAIPTAGKYPFVCILHAASGMTGVIEAT